MSPPDDRPRAYEDDRQQEYFEELRKYIQTRYGDLVQDLPAEEFDRRLRFGIERARRHGLTQPDSITIFVAMMFFVDPRFDEYPPARAALSEDRVPPNERVDLMMKLVSNEQWVEARKRLAPADWSDARKRAKRNPRDIEGRPAAGTPVRRLVDDFTVEDPDFPDSLAGCDPVEIEHLEALSGHPIPSVYREFLEILGKSM